MKARLQTSRQARFSRASSAPGKTLLTPSYLLTITPRQVHERPHVRTQRAPSARLALEGAETSV